jgi:hypothetical protein
MDGMDPLLVSSFISMLLAGWNWSQAAGYRRGKARLAVRERDLTAEWTGSERTPGGRVCPAARLRADLLDARARRPAGAPRTGGRRPRRTCA